MPKKKHEKLLQEYKRQKATLVGLSKKILRFRKDSEAAGNQRADDLRAELDTVMRQTGYTPML